LSVKLGSGERLPPLCVVCGAAATETCHVSLLPPATTHETVDFFTKVFAALAGILIVSRPSRVRPEYSRLQLPTCAAHASAAQIKSAVSVTAIDHRTAILRGVSYGFQQGVLALQAHVAPLTAAAMGALDAGKPAEPNDFLQELQKSSPQDAEDFLRELERRDRGG
jgi:hypothetical protein